MLIENVISALQNAKTVAVMFPGSAKVYTYKVPAEWEVEAGDSLVVDSPHNGLTLVKVMQVHAQADIDFTANFVYKWAVQKVDVTAYNERVNNEKHCAKQLRELKQRKEKEQLLRNLLADLGDDAKAILDAVIK